MIETKCPVCGGVTKHDDNSRLTRCPYCDTELPVQKYDDMPKDAAASAKNPLVIQCRNCGGTAGYDIQAQSYRCPHCGETSGIEEVKKEILRWRTLQHESLEAEKTANQNCFCSKCGAAFLFAEGEATHQCQFCGNALVRNEFEESIHYPEMIIPFVLTMEEAVEQLKKWCGDNAKTPEAKAIKDNLSKLDGWYLPYQMIRGPVNVTVHRDAAWRVYHCDGYLEGSVVCTAENLDNMVLEAVEPFDLNGLLPFEHGYIAAHKARLQDISDHDTSGRILEEAAEDYRPYVETVMQTKGCDLDLDAKDLMNIPILLPMYIIRGENLFAAVNGQTGKVAVTVNRMKRHFIKFVEPTILTLTAYAIFMWLCRNYETARDRLGLPLMGTVIIGLIFFAGFEKELKTKLTRVILSSIDSVAYRVNRKLTLLQGENLLKNTFSNIPSFYEEENGKRIPVDICFYPPSRKISFLLRALAVFFLPYLVALLIRIILLGAWTTPFAVLFSLNFANGCLWLLMMLAYIPEAYTRVFRECVYNHPFLYERGTKRLLGTRKDRRVNSMIYMKEFWGNEYAKKKKQNILILGSVFVLSVLTLLFL